MILSTFARARRHGGFFQQHVENAPAVPPQMGNFGLGWFRQGYVSPLVSLGDDYSSQAARDGTS